MEYLGPAHRETSIAPDGTAEDFDLRHRGARRKAAAHARCPCCGLPQPGQPSTPDPRYHECRMVELFEQFIISIQKNGLPVRLLPPE